MIQNIQSVSLLLHVNEKDFGNSINSPTNIFLESSDISGDHGNIKISLIYFGKSWVGQSRTRSGLVIHLYIFFPPYASGSKSQNCLWNSLIDGLTGNVKEKPRPTIVPDPRPPEEILADELPQLDSPEALVKTSFRFDGLQLSSIFLICF